ncbi:MAG TPA: TIR domain-containing protein [Tepidisphaeraceae bacterium]|jgi:predicted nucleotide-binding protein|nr:TIR domain-containing protein [Tepidisphaeraceae bacterium]
MPKTRIFIGSSAAAKSQAKAVIEHFTNPTFPTLEFVPWWDYFTPGRTLLEDLDGIRNRSDAALLLFSPEAESTVRGNVVQMPNLNVLFELGYFYGQLGKAKVAMLKYGDFYLPTDLGGYIHIFGSTFFRRSAVVQVDRRTEREFSRWVQQL